MYVIKRDGTTEPLNLDKIHKMVALACENLDVSMSLIETTSKIQFFDGITTEYIQNVLVNAANKLIDLDTPDYQYAAARLLLFGLYKSLFPHWQKDGLDDLWYHINKYEHKYDPILLTAYSRGEWQYLNNHIEHSKDYKFTYASLQQLIDKYLIHDKNTGFIYETPQIAYMLIAATVYSNYPVGVRLQKIINYYHAISDHEINLPTPIIAGVRSKQKSFASCFPAGQLVHTSEGLKEIEKINVGDIVLTHNGQYKPVLAINAKDYNGDYVRINTYATLNNQFVSTDEHLVFAAKDVKCFRGNVHRSCLKSQDNYKYCYKTPLHYSSNCENLNKFDLFKPTWVSAKELDNSYWVSVPYNKNIINIEYLIISDIIDIGSKYVIDEAGNITYNSTRLDLWHIPNKFYLNSDFFRLVGYYLAEGYATDGGSMGFTFGTKDKYIIDDCVNIINNIFGHVVCPSDNQRDNSTKVSINSRVFTKFIIQLCGNKFDKKFICQTLMNSPLELQKELLIGVIRGDGCAYYQGLQISLSNKQLIYQLYDIALRLHLSPTINVIKYDDGIRSDSYTMYFSRSADYEFILEVGKDIYKVEPTDKTYAYGIWKNGNYFTKVKTVDIIKSNSYDLVYDLQVADDESFVVSGIAVHNCALIDVGDTTKSIGTSNYAIGLLTAASSGIGLNVGRMRSIDSSIRNGAVKHPGIVPFLKMFEATGKAFKQAHRGGSVTCYNTIWNYEIETIIQLKNNKGTEESSVRHMDYCIQMSELFYKRFINNENITLFCNSDTPGLYESFGSDEFDKLYEYYETQDVRKKVISMQKLFLDLVEQRSDTSRIYLMNIDHANSHSPYQEQVYMSNLCVAPETELLTKRGYFPIGDLENQLVTIWNGFEWSDVIVRKTGRNQELINVKFQDDKGNIHNIECTDYHKFFVQNGEQVIEVRAKDLIVGQYLQNWNPPEFPIDSDIRLYQYHRDWWVYSVENNTKISDTYCLTEPKRNRMVLNGILTGNCVEIIQPSRPLCDINDTGINEYTVAVKKDRVHEFEQLLNNSDFFEMRE